MSCSQAIQKGLQEHGSPGTLISFAPGVMEGLGYKHKWYRNLYSLLCLKKKKKKAGLTSGLETDPAKLVWILNISAFK